MQNNILDNFIMEKIYKMDNHILIKLTGVKVFFIKLTIQSNETIRVCISENENLSGFTEIENETLIIYKSTFSICISQKKGIILMNPLGIPEGTIEGAAEGILAGEEIFSWNLSKGGFLVWENKDGNTEKIMWEYYSKAEGYFGFGEKYDRVNQVGLSPSTYVTEHFTHQGKDTYFPMPFFLTEKGWGFYNATDYITDFHMDKENSKVVVSAVVDSEKVQVEKYWFFGTPKEITAGFQKLTGECMLPPKWSFGPWMSANGWSTQKETLEQVQRTKELAIPATVIVLEAWSDEENFYIFNGAKYEPLAGGEYLHYEDFLFSEDGQWPNPKEMVENLHEQGLKIILWQIPIIKPSKDYQNKQLEIDEQYAFEKKFCVMKPDGKEYRIPKNWFAGSMIIDFTNPKAVAWWMNKRAYLVDELKVDGFKTDGGEFVYDDDALFYNGKYGKEMRNPYPNTYVKAYYDFVNKKNGGITFSRAGYVGAQAMPMHWAGDQVSEFSELRAQIRAGLSLGLSGIPFWGFDIGGFAGDLPSTDLYIRAAQVAAFSPVMQYHSEPRTGQFGNCNRRSFINDRTPWNMEKVNNDESITRIYKKYANLRMNLLPYIYNEAIYAKETGRPLFAHLIIDFPYDRQVINLEDEYMFGRSLLIAPVMEEGGRSRSMYIPKGKWYDFWTGEMVLGGKTIEMECPLHNIIVFVKEQTLLPMNLSGDLQIAGNVGNRLDTYQNLCFKLFGDQSCTYYKDDLGNDFIISMINGKASVEGSREAEAITIITDKDNYVI